MPKTNSQIHNIAVTILGNLLLPVVAFVTAPILARGLGVQGRGELAAATAPYLLLSVVASFGLPDAVTHFVARQQLSDRRAITLLGVVTFGAGLLGLGCVALAAPILSGGNEELSSLMITANLALPMFLLLGLVRGFASGRKEWGLVAGEQAIFGASRLALVLLCFLTHNLTVWTGTLIFSLTPVVGALAYGKLLRPRTTLQRSEGEVGLAKVGRYGLQVWIGGISSVLLYRLDQTLMVPLSDANQLGLYVVAVSVGEIPPLISMAIRNVTFADESEESVVDRLAQGSRLATLSCLGMGAVLGTLAPWGVPAVFGGEFVGAVEVSWILLLSAVIAAPGIVAGAGLAGRGMPQLRSVALTVSCVANGLLVFLLVPPLGAVGAGWATVGGTVATTLITFYFVRIHISRELSIFLWPKRADFLVVRRALMSVFRLGKHG